MQPSPLPLPGPFTRHRYAILFAALLATIAVGPLLEALDFGRVFMEVLLTASLVAAVAPIGVLQKRRAMLAILGLALALRWYASHSESASGSAVAALLWCGVAVVAACGAIRYSLSSVRIDAEHLCAALSAYLLVGVCWGVIYVAVVRLQPDAMLFAGAPLAHGLGMGDAIYFSFVTLATLGYGDITPVSQVARGLATLEAITGQLFLALLVARLVGLRSSAPSR